MKKNDLLPVTVLSGFLGAGKTVLSHWAMTPRSYATRLSTDCVDLPCSIPKECVSQSM